MRFRSNDAGPPRPPGAGPRRRDRPAPGPRGRGGRRSARRRQAVARAGRRQAAARPGKSRAASASTRASSITPMARHLQGGEPLGRHRLAGVGEVGRGVRGHGAVEVGGGAPGRVVERVGQVDGEVRDERARASSRSPAAGRSQKSRPQRARRYIESRRWTSTRSVPLRSFCRIGERLRARAARSSAPAPRSRWRARARPTAPSAAGRRA